MRIQKQSVATIEPMENRLHLDSSQLTVSLVSSTLPASVSDESVIRGTVTVNVANNSGATQKFKASVGVLYADGLLNFQSGAYGTLTSKSMTISLKSGVSKQYKLPVSIAKGKLADATNTLFAAVSDSSGAESQSPAGPTLTVRKPIVSLSETELFHKLPVTVAPSTRFNTSDRISITNSGSDPSVDPLILSIYASTSGSITGLTPLVLLPARKITVPAGRTVAVSIPIHDTAGLPAGTYKMISVVNQSNGTITTTNPAIAPVLTVPAPITAPQFVETILTAAPQYNSSTGALSEMDVQLFLENKGATSTGPSQYALFVSTSATFDSSAVQLNSLPLTQTVEGEDSGQNVQVDWSIAQPNPIHFNGGSYYVYVQVTDPDGGVSMAGLSTPITIT